MNVILRLPAESLVRLKSVCTIWRKLISHPRFVEAHMIWNEDNLKVLILSDTDFLYSVDCNNEEFDKGIAVARKLEFEYPNKWSEVWNSYRGMVLATDLNYRLHLLYPSILESTMLPQLPAAGDPICSKPMYGLGYSRSLDDYLVVQVSCHSNADDGAEVRYICLNIYELKNNTWQPEEHVIANYEFFDCSHPPHLPTCRCRRMVLVNGCLHWLCTRISDLSTVICAYNLEHDTNHESPLPFWLYEPMVAFSSLTVCEERLCIVFSYINGIPEEDVWMLMEYGVPSSWTKITSQRVASSRVDIDKILEDKIVQGIPAQFRAKLFYLDSLFSIKGHIDDEEREVDAEEQHIDAEEQQFDAEEQHFDDDEQQFDDEEQHIDDEEQQFDVEEQHSDDEEQQFDVEEQHIDDEEQQYDDEEQHFDDEEQEEQQFDAEDQHIDDEVQQFDDEEQHIDDEDQHIDDEVQQFDDEEQHIDDEVQNIDDEE